MAVRPIDGNKLIEWFSPYLHTGEPIPADVVIEDIRSMPTLTPPNEWVSVEDELPARDGVYLVFTTRGSVTTAHFYAEKTFSDGHRKSANWQGNRNVTHWMLLPAPPGKDNNVPAKTPNEPLTQEDIDKMHFDRVWIDYGLDDSGERCGEDGVILYGKLYSIDTLDGSAFEDLLLNACDGETLGRPSGDYTVYRRPPEVQS